MNPTISQYLQKMGQPLQLFSYKLTGNQADAADLYQDTVMKIITHADKFEVDTNFKAWAMTIMKNLFINNYRKEKRRQRISAENSTLHRIYSADSIENEALVKIKVEELTNMVNKLNHTYKMPFEMAYKGYKYEEIASILQLPVGTIKSRIFIARKKISEHLQTLEMKCQAAQLSYN